MYASAEEGSVEVELSLSEELELLYLDGEPRVPSLRLEDSN